MIEFTGTKDNFLKLGISVLNSPRFIADEYPATDYTSVERSRTLQRDTHQLTELDNNKPVDDNEQCDSRDTLIWFSYYSFKSEKCSLKYLH